MHTQYLSLRSVLAMVDKTEWGDIGESKFPVWVLVAGKDSVCRPENLKGMVDMMPRARVVHFEEAFHSIHNSRTEDFVQAIENVYGELELMQAFEDINSETDGHTTLRM